MEIPKIGSRWKINSNSNFDLSLDYNGYNGYTVICVTNLAHKHENHPPQVVYVGDNKNPWSLPLNE